MDKTFPLYRPELEHDACGVGFLADIRGRRSHELVERGLAALMRLTHRGAAVNATADGAGILSQIPWKLFLPDLPAGFLGSDGLKAAGVFFFPPDAAESLRPIIEDTLKNFGWKPVLWRRMPVQPEVLSADLRASAPECWQLFAAAQYGQEGGERQLYLARLRMEQQISQLEIEGFSVVSLSATTLVYKGLLFPEQLPCYYPDLRHPDFETALMIFHQRFSTNTFPRWELAQPFHVLAHNGEINTITGNRLWMHARQADPTCLPGLQRAGKVIKGTGSDSQSLDEAAELLRHFGFSLPHALSRLIPPAWENDQHMSREVRAFYEFQSCFSEPWDGPAAIAFSDGRRIGALLDRNGFRPSRFVRTTDDRFFLGSEAGIFGLPDEEIAQRGRLGPGEMVMVDTVNGTIQNSTSVQHQLATQHPYRFWIKHKLKHVDDYQSAAEIKIETRHAASLRQTHTAASPSPALRADVSASEELLRLQKLFGYTREEIELILSPMAEEGKEAVGSMGDDTPPAVLSGRNRLLPDYFRQRFAQVTNPPMDSLREYSVMSLKTVLGARGNFLEEGALDTRLLSLPSPVLRQSELDILLRLPDFRAATIPILFAAHLEANSLQEELDRIAAEACQAVQEGAVIVVLSDRDTDHNLAPIPPLLATSAVHHALIEQGLRLQTSLIVETGEARDSHQVATLLAYGAAAVSPYLAFRTASLIAGDDSLVTRAHAESLYQHALEQGLLKIFSKMGVSTLSGYCGGQLFEILGLDSWLTGRFFPDTPALLDGATLRDIASRTLERHAAAFSEDSKSLEHPGFHSYRRDGEYHAYNPALVRQFHRVTTTGSGESYRDFAQMV
ncbi:MAG TPA: glutamate synthase central domain-containing protein, partial [Acidobacteriota bacterium]|nr:glutamate synthase central domain-containing protein [Acidobacteriota bacterium]